MNIFVLHGPNLNLLGEREPEIYGSTTLEQIDTELKRQGTMQNAIVKTLQSNHEGVLIDTLHENRKWADALIINPGAFTHYSYALRDAIAAFAKPTIEVHLSDLTRREEFRKFSVLEGLQNVMRIMGKGAAGYYEALDKLTKK
ncbi:MAG: type II 3-dehydroquinate dehydratase [Candidatus Kapaibacterium sp.]